ncbi:MAG: YdcF family protein [Desulfobacterales bacterium]|nr:YdcF family protein [Desulfobacterales bacterium]
MLTNENIICISSIDWDFVWQGHQEIMSTFAKNGNRVLFIENTGVRTLVFHDLPRLKKRIVNWVKSVKGFRQEMDNLYVFSPIFFPFPYSKIAQLINRFLFLNTLKKWLRITRFSNPIIWTFLPTQTTLNLINNIEHKLVVYYSIADFAQLTNNPKKLKETERQLLRISDVVFAQGEEIKNRCLEHNQNVYIFPFGVNIENFLSFSCDNPNVPEDIKNIVTPRLGYIGGIHKHIDFDLVKTLAKRNSKWSFVFVGPVQTDIAKLQHIENVHFLGKKEFTDLPAYVNSFDACLIPYLLSEYTRTVYPTKINEYLVMKKPVVSTPLPEVIKFNNENGNLVYIGKNDAEFEEQINKVLKEDDPIIAQLRLEVAKKNSWPQRIEEMSQFIGRALTKKESEKLNWQEQMITFYWKYRKSFLKVGVTLAAAFYLLFFSPLIWYLAKPLEIREKPKRADAIVVLAGGVGESGKAGEGYEERVETGVMLYKKGYAQDLIFSSGYVFVFKEPDVMKALAVSLGVPENHIILEKKAGNTHQNVVYVNEILNQKDWKRLILITSPFHMRRVSLVFDKIAPDKEVIYTPITYSYYYGWPRKLRWFSMHKQITTEQIRGIMHEYIGILYYWWKGYL